MKKNILLLLLFFSAYFLQAQNIPIGDWRVHLPYNFATSVEQVEDEIYCASQQGLFSYNRSDNSVQLFSRINGLSDIGISYLKYHQELKTLLIAYENGNIDLKIGNEFFNISAIKDKNTTGKKNINHVIFKSDFAYLSCGFGIVELDLIKKEIKNTFIIGPNGAQIEVHALAQSPDSFYAATEVGLFRANLQHPNLSDFNAWKLDDELGIQNFSQIVFLNNKIYLAKDTILHIQDENHNWSSIQISEAIESLETKNDQLIIATFFRAKIYDKDFTLRQTAPKPFTEAIKHAILDDRGRVWMADARNGLIQYFTNFVSAEQIVPNGPFSADVYNISTFENEIFVAAGGIKETSFAGLFSSDGFYKYDGQIWKNVNPKLQTQLLGTFDYMMARKHPSDGRTYVASWSDGLLVFKDETLNAIYKDNNSTLEAITNDIVRAGSLDFDALGNIWVTNPGGVKPLSVLRTNGSWESFRTGIQNELKIVLVDESDQKWLISRNGQLGLLANNNSNHFLFNSAEGSGNIHASVNCMVEDKDGAIWVGTNEGPVIFYSPSLIFNGGNPDAQRLKVQQGEFVGFLLGNEVITCIAIDGANRKWFGTLNGVFWMSDDGTEQIENFTTLNSPLLSNTIISIGINDQTGEVFIGTDKGIVSYRATATEGKEQHENVLVFPNPVRPEYEGLIAIKGLVNNAYVKITDVSGTLIYQTRANGGQAIWDGKNYNGKKAQSGVYLVFSMDEQGIENFVSKILFMN